MTLELDKHPCRIGKSMSTNTEHHGDEDVGAIDLPLDGIMLTGDELDALLGNGAHAALYVYPPPTANDAGLPAVRFASLDPLKLKQHFEHAHVEVWLGYDEDVAMEWSDCKLRRIVLTPQAGGLTQMKCSVRVCADPEDVGQLYEYLNADGAVSISGAQQAKPKGKDQQSDLPLGENGEGEGSEGEESEAA